MRVDFEFTTAIHNKDAHFLREVLRRIENKDSSYSLTIDDRQKGFYGIGLCKNGMRITKMIFNEYAVSKIKIRKIIEAEIEKYEKGYLKP